MGIPMDEGWWRGEPWSEREVMPEPIMADPEAPAAPTTPCDAVVPDWEVHPERYVSLETEVVDAEGVGVAELVEARTPPGLSVGVDSRTQKRLTPVSSQIITHAEPLEIGVPVVMDQKIPVGVSAESWKRRRTAKTASTEAASERAYQEGYHHVIGGTQSPFRRT